MGLDRNRASAEDLVDLYLRLRDEFDDGERNLDPNQKIRASIVMAAFSAAETFSSDLKAIERSARAMLGQTALSVSSLHRTMLEEYSPAFDVAFPAFAVDVERWGSIAGFFVDGDSVRGATWRRPVMGDEAVAAYVDAMAAMAG